MSGKKLFGIIAAFAVIVISMTGCPAEDPAGDPALTGTVSISGIAGIGEILTVNTSELNGKEVISCQWMRADTAEEAGTDINGANTDSYTLTMADLGKYFSVTVTCKGYTGSKTSDSVGPAAMLPLTGTVTIKGDTWIDGVLTADISGLGGAGTVKYTWLADDEEIPDADKAKYTVNKLDHGKIISVTAEREFNTGAITGTLTKTIVRGWMVKTVAEYFPKYDDSSAGNHAYYKFQNFYGLAIDSKDNLYMSGDIAYIGGCLAMIDTAILKTDPDFAGTAYTTNGDPNARYLAVGPDDAVYIDKVWGKDVTKYPQPLDNYEWRTGNIITAAGFEDNALDGDLTVDADGNVYVISQYHGPSIIKISADGQTISKFAGSEKGYAEGPGLTAKFQDLGGITVDPDGNIYVADGYNDGRIRKITPDGEVSTFAGGGWGAPFTVLRGLTYGNDGNFYVVDDEKVVRKITPQGEITLFAGNTGEKALIDGLALSEARFLNPWGIAAASDGTVYVLDDSAIGTEGTKEAKLRMIYFDDN